MNRDDFVLSLARQAYLEKPFYRWFYDGAGIDVENAGAQDLPFLTKRDFFRYQAETGQPYYLPLGYDELQVNLLRTSGTTGQPLVIPWLSSEWSFLYNSLLLNFISQINGRPRFLNAVNPNQIEKLKAFEAVLVNVPQNRMADAPYVLDVIKSRRPNVFIDNSPGLWFKYLLEHGLDPNQAGIQIVCAYPNQELAEQVTMLGLKYFSAYGCMETGFIGYAHAGMGEVYHLSDATPADQARTFKSSRDGLLGGVRVQLLAKLFPCDCYQGLDLQNLVGKRDVRVRTNGGRMEMTGSGELVVTCANSVFPFIKYLNDDLVEIFAESRCACGFFGHSMRFRCREHGVQIPYIGGGMNISLEGISRQIKGFRRVLPVHYAPNSAVRIVVTFVEDDAVNQPCADTGLADQIMAASSGFSEQMMLQEAPRREYAPFFPAIRVPTGMIPMRDGDSLKARLYLDAVSGHVPDEYRPLLALIEQLLDLPAIVTIGHWFLTPRAQAEQP